MPPIETTAYLGLGSNMGDREEMLAEALRLVSEMPGTDLRRRSSIYETKPWGKTDQPDFLNMVAEISTTMSPEDLLQHSKQIEAALGRTRGERWGARPIDIDILLYGNLSMRTPSLIFPHERMWERAFVLRPLAELRPDLTNPGGLSILELLNHENIASQGVYPYKLERDNDGLF